MPPYEASFAVGTRVQIADRARLDDFARTWRYHDPLLPEQLAWAGAIATVTWVGYYHGGDPLYGLEGVPGTWHEECITADESHG